MKINLLVDGGDMKPGPAISQKLGPAGINMGKFIQEVNKATASFKGMKVPVEADVDTKTKTFTLSVKSPPVAELLKKEAHIELGSGKPNRFKSANLSIEQIILVAKTKMPNMLSKTLKLSVKSVLGSCVSLGILVESKDPKEVQEEIEKGKYDLEINNERTETPAEKKQELDAHFEKVKAQQDAILKKEAEEAAKAAEEKAATATAAPAAGAAPATPGAPAKAAAPAAAPGKVAAPPAKADAKKK